MSKSPEACGQCYWWDRDDGEMGYCIAPVPAWVFRDTLSNPHEEAGTVHREDEIAKTCASFKWNAGYIPVWEFIK